MGLNLKNFTRLLNLLTILGVSLLLSHMAQAASSGCFETNRFDGISIKLLFKNRTPNRGEFQILQNRKGFRETLFPIGSQSAVLSSLDGVHYVSANGRVKVTLKEQKADVALPNSSGEGRDTFLLDENCDQNN